VTSAAAERSAHAYVLDEGGNLLAHPDHARVLAHENWAERPLVRASSIRDQGSSIDRSSDPRLEDRVIGVWRRVPELGWRVLVEVPAHEFRAPMRTLARRVALGASAVSLLFLALGLSLVRRILLPLRELREGVLKIGAGDVGARLDVRTGDELEDLAGAVNQMAESLGQAERMRQDLTHMIVHDLKSPLSSILGSMDYVLTLAKGNLTPEQTKMLSLGNKAGKDLLRLIQNLLDLGKMEQGRLELQSDHFSILELAGQCVDDLEALILRENKFISIDMAANLPKVWGDRDLVHRVLANLLTNALKHTPRGTEISVHVSLSEKGDAHVLCVRDTGEGVPKEFLTKIFDKFSQAESKKKNVRVGSGLGLAFCKLAVEAHGGRIWVESEPGRGSAFFFTLPRALPLKGGGPTPAEHPRRDPILR
jgi:signal transduction histidine kinase